MHDHLLIADIVESFRERQPERAVLATGANEGSKSLQGFSKART
jgi:hypothetical protein